MKRLHLKKKLSKILSPAPPPERGPQNLPASSQANGLIEDTPITLDVLDKVMARQYKAAPFKEPVIALEILHGPYKGIVFMFTNFIMKAKPDENGMVATRYETEILVVPPELQGTFVKDEAFDAYTTEIVVAWLHYIHTHDLSPLIKSRVSGRYGVQ